MSHKTRIILSYLIMALGIIGSIVFVFYWDRIKNLAGYGYPFIFLQSFIAGSPFPVIDPYMVVVFTMAPILNPLLVGLVSGLGVASGQTTAFLMGRMGRISYLTGTESNGTARRRRRPPRWTIELIKWAHRKGSVAVFLLSALFNPVFTPIAVAMGALKFQVLNFFIMCLAGNTLKSLVIAYAGYFGLGTILRWLGVK
ncbi:MAG: VTT domain-containing protein [Chloroflexota bacterium]